MLLLLPAAAAQEPADPPRGDLRFAVFGDFNGPYGSLDYPPAVPITIRSLTGVWRPDLLLSPGDVIAGQNRSLPDARFAQMWNAFDASVAAPLRAAGIPYAFAMGNHDASSLLDAEGRHLFAREREAAESYWSNPMYEANLRYVDRHGHPFDYAFLFGESFVVVLDASSAKISREQRRWLEELLATPVARQAKLRIVLGHLPLVPVGRGREAAGEILADAGEIRRILEDGRVDLYISGHHAAYYPGRLGDLELLFAGGVGARPLLAGTAPPRSTVTLVDVWWEPLVLRYSTFDVATMELLAPASLPRSIGAGEATIRLSTRAFGLRDDTGGEGQSGRSEH